MKVQIAELNVPNLTYGFIFDQECLNRIRECFLNDKNDFTVRVDGEQVGITNSVYQEGDSLYANIELFGIKGDLIKNMNMIYKPVGWFSFVETPEGEPTLVDYEKIKIHNIRGTL